jgi:hypothetical protein
MSALVVRPAETAIVSLGRRCVETGDGATAGKRREELEMTQISSNTIGWRQGGTIGFLMLAITTMSAVRAQSSPQTGSASLTNADADVKRVASLEESSRMAEYLRTLVAAEDVRVTLRTEDGDTVDCVDVYRQPALKEAGMALEPIQFAPTTLPTPDDWSSPTLPGGATPQQESAAPPQVACPIGTVPIRRLTLDTLERFRTLDEFRKKIPNHIEDPRVGATANHQYAQASRVIANRGAETTLNLWSPYVERSNEFSLSQMWVTRGSGSNLETVEAGWQSYRDLYGDNRSRLFVYFTPDNYGSRGCYNLTCGAFVQVSNSIYVGGAWSQYSVPGGAQYEIKLSWYKDGTNGNWWLKYGDTWVGYYPRSRFDSYGLRDQAGQVTFGGEIVNMRAAGRHTSTDMGSGRFPGAGFRKAAYQRALRYFDTTSVSRPASGLTPYRTDMYCYNVLLYSATGAWQRYFFFGGSGYNANCQ